MTGLIDDFAVFCDAASDDLEVVQLLLFTKSFDGPTPPTGTVTLTFTITNPGSDTATDLSFSDDLDDVISGLIAISLPALPCGPGSSLSGVSLLTLTGGELPPTGGMCSFDVEVLVPITATQGSFLNATSDLFRAGLPVADPATAFLEIPCSPRADPSNAFKNGHFDCDAPSWMLLGSAVAHHPTMDLDDPSTSGSAKLSDGVGGAELSVGQCVAVQLEGVYRFSGSAFLASVGTVVYVIPTTTRSRCLSIRSPSSCRVRSSPTASRVAIRRGGLLPWTDEV